MSAHGKSQLAALLALSGLFGFGSAFVRAQGVSRPNLNSGSAQTKEIWGESVHGAKLSLSAPSFLRVGQPFRFSLKSVPRSVKPPNYIRLRPEHARPMILEIADAHGKPIPFLQHQDPILGPIGPPLPPEAHARGRYWKPGVYHLRIVHELVGDPLNPLPPGTKRFSNTVRVEIAEPDAPMPSPLRDPKTRKRVLDLIEDLDSPSVEKRDGAEKALKDYAVFALPLLEDAMRKAPIEPFKRLLRLHTAAVTEAREKHHFADLEEETWKIVARNLGEMELRGRMERAHHMPILMLSEKELVKLLDHKEPDVRLRAIRSLPRTANKATLEKLLTCLDDPYYEMDGFPNQFPVFPLAYEAQEAIAFQGEPFVPLLLELASMERPGKEWPYRDRCPYRKEVAEIFGKMGPSPAAERFLVGMLRGEKNDNVRGYAYSALSQWGRGSVPVFLKLLENLKVDDYGLNHTALRQLTEFGEADEVGDFLRRMLRPDVQDSLLTARAIEGISRLKLRDTIPDLKRIALSERADTYARSRALQGLVALARKEDAAEVLMALAGPKTHPSVRYEAIYRLAELRHMPAVPKLLAALEDNNGHEAEIADWGLRVLASLPNGVGFSEKSRNAEVWRKWWQDNKGI